MGFNLGAAIGGFAKSQSKLFDEAREDNREDMRYLRNHYMETVVPAYHKAKAGQKVMKESHASLVADGVHPDWAIRGLRAGQSIPEIRKEWLMLPEKDRIRPSDIQPMGDARPGAPVSPTESDEAPAGPTPVAMPEVANPASPSEGFFTGSGKRSFYGRMSLGEMSKTVGAQVAQLAGVDQEHVDTWMKEAYAPITDALPTDTGVQFNRNIPWTEDRMRLFDAAEKVALETGGMDALQAVVSGDMEAAQRLLSEVQPVTAAQRLAHDAKEGELDRQARAASSKGSASASVRAGEIKAAAKNNTNEFGEFDRNGRFKGFTADAQRQGTQVYNISSDMLNMIPGDQQMVYAEAARVQAGTQGVLMDAVAQESLDPDWRLDVEALPIHVQAEIKSEGYIGADGKVVEGAALAPTTKFRQIIGGPAPASVPTVSEVPTVASPEEQMAAQVTGTEVDNPPGYPEGTYVKQSDGTWTLKE